MVAFPSSRMNTPHGKPIIGDVVRHTEENLEIVECFTPGNSECVIQPGCRLKTVLGEALDSFLATLDLYTLADFLEAK